MAQSEVSIFLVALGIFKYQTPIGSLDIFSWSDGFKIRELDK